MSASGSVCAAGESSQCIRGTAFVQRNGMSSKTPIHRPEGRNRQRGLANKETARSEQLVVSYPARQWKAKVMAMVNGANNQVNQQQALA